MKRILAALLAITILTGFAPFSTAGCFVPEDPGYVC